MAEKELEQQAPHNRFDPVKVKKDRSATKRIAIFIFIAAGALFTLVTAAILNSGDDLASSDAPAEIIEASGGASIFLPPPPRRAEPPEPARAAAPAEPEPAAQEPVSAPAQPRLTRTVRPAYVPAPGGDRARNVTNQKRQAQAQRIQAAAAPTAIQGFGRQQNPLGGGSMLPGDDAGGLSPTTAAATGVAGAGAGGDMSLVQDVTAGTAADPNGWARKENFLNQPLPAEYSQHTRAFPVSKLELKAGSLLPCVLISGLNSDLPGNLIAQVSENVWDTATGRCLLIPRGSRLVGTYDNQITYGQSRVLVIWSRLVFPDGSSLLLDNLQGSDQAGYSGFKGRVDRHWGTMIGSALLVSLLGAGVELAVPSNNNNTYNNNRKDVSSILSERVATAIAEAMTQIITKGINRQPTITVKPGYRFTIFVQHDVVFPKTWNVAQGR